MSYCIAQPILTPLAQVARLRGWWLVELAEFEPSGEEDLGAGPYLVVFAPRGERPGDPRRRYLFRCRGRFWVRSSSAGSVGSLMVRR